MTLLNQNCFKHLYVAGGMLTPRHLTSLSKGNIIVTTDEHTTFDCILLLGGVTEIMKQLGNLRANTDRPIICGGNLSSYERAAVLDYGADWVVSVEQISSEELLAHLRAIARLKNLKSSIVTQTSLYVDESNVLHFAGQSVRITSKKAELFRLLSNHAGKPLTKDRILSSLYGGVDEPNMKIVDVFICKLRKRLVQLGCPGSQIETVWGSGYKLNLPKPLAALAA